MRIHLYTSPPPRTQVSQMVGTKTPMTREAFLPAELDSPRPSRRRSSLAAGAPCNER